MRKRGRKGSLKLHLRAGVWNIRMGCSVVEIGRSLRFQPGETEEGMKAALLGVSSGLNQALSGLRGGLLRSAWGMDIGSGCRIAFSATLDRTSPRGVHIGAETEVSSRADIRAHDSIHLQ